MEMTARETMRDVETAFDEAVAEADQTFLFDVHYISTFDPEEPMGVSVPHFLNINYNTPMLWALRPCVDSLKEAWILILAHESGHLRLNAACAALGLDPILANSQMTAIGFSPAELLMAKAAPFQKESSIEAYCDACLANAAMDFLGSRWRDPVKALREHRAAAGESLGLFQGDEYATESSLDAILETGVKMMPSHAARIAFDASIRRTSSFKKTAVAGARAFSGFRTNLAERINQWRGRENPQKTDDPPGRGPPRHDNP